MENGIPELRMRWSARDLREGLGKAGQAAGHRETPR